MLTITIKAREEAWNSKTERFMSLDRDWTLQLEHSLISISKWEAKHKKPYLDDDPEHKKTADEIIDYIKCMTITPNVDPNVYMFLSSENIKDIEEYINDPQTATWFSDPVGGKGRSSKMRREVMTTEVIYYYMIANDIPWEAQKWHINRLLTLIRVCSEKNSDSPKMSKKDILSRNSALNKARRMAMHSKG